MSKSNSFETSLLSMIFNNQAIANVGDAAGVQPSVAPGSFYLRLYTDAVVVSDSVVGTEAAYTGYVTGGIAVARSGAGWTVVGNNATNAAAVTFGACSAGSENLRYFAVWLDNTTTLESHRLYWGTLTSDLAVSTGITPEFAIGSINVNED